MFITDPGIYHVAKNNKEWFLEPYLPSFTIPPKVYGNLNTLANRFWRSFSMNNKSLGVMLTGESGSGKTTLAEILGNIGIANKFAVILVTDVEVDLKLIKFIDRLDRCIIIFDEFAKNFNKMQDKMLTMFNDLSMSKKMFIITENDSRDISKYIRNRPGRIKYHIDFKRVKEAVIIDYCGDFKVNFDGQFYKDMLAAYNKSISFSFDHLQAMVDEHVHNPKDSFDYLLELLNLEILTKAENVIPVKVFDTVEKKNLELDESTRSVDKKSFDNGRNLWLYPRNGSSLSCGKNDVMSVTDDSITCMINNRYEVTLDVA